MSVAVARSLGAAAATVVATGVPRNPVAALALRRNAVTAVGDAQAFFGMPPNAHRAL